MEAHEAPIHPGPWGEFPDRYWEAYFGRQAPYYMRQLQRRRTDTPTQFNWAAFLLGFGWMIYRRMYLVALCAFILLSLEGMVESLVLYAIGVDERSMSGFNGAMGLLLGALLGALANRIYLWDARRSIREVLAHHGHLHEAEVLARIARRGGTSWLAIIVLLVAALLVVVLVDQLTYADTSFL